MAEQFIFDFDCHDPCSIYTISEFNKFCKSKQKNLFIVHSNIRSYYKNGDELIATLSQLDNAVDILALSETWFSEDYHTGVNGYSSFHSYRTNKRGGGISLFVKNCYNASIIPEFTYVSDIIELCTVKVDIKEYELYVIGVYRPPNKSNVDLVTEKIKDVLDGFDRNKNIVLIGDFNIDLLYGTESETEFFNMCLLSSFFPLINKGTRLNNNSSTCIDNIFYNQTVDYHSGIIPACVTVKIILNLFKMI